MEQLFTKLEIRPTGNYELDCILFILEALSQIGDDKAKQRIMRYCNEVVTSKVLPEGEK